MHRRLARSLIIAVGLLPSLAATGAEAQAPRLSQVTWLAGCWESRRGDRLIEEQWMRPGGGTMIGMSRTVAGDSTREFEYMQIREEEGRLRIIYRSEGDGSLTARIEGEQAGQTKGIDFPMRRVPCAEAGGR